MPSVRSWLYFLCCLCDEALPCLSVGLHNINRLAIMIARFIFHAFVRGDTDHIYDISAFCLFKIFNKSSLSNQNFTVFLKLAALCIGPKINFSHFFINLLINLQIKDALFTYPVSHTTIIMCKIICIVAFFQYCTAIPVSGAGSPLMTVWLMLML